MIEATVSNLGIEKLPVSFMGFTPKYYYVNSDGVHYVLEDDPISSGDVWIT